MVSFQLSFLDSLFKRKIPVLGKSPSIQPKRQKNDPELYSIWLSLQSEFFPHLERLKEYRVVWSSRRQLRTLASCHLDSKKVIVAREMATNEAREWLAPLLYHEMCHAVVGRRVSKGRRKRNIWHGTEFKALEAEHPSMEGFNLWVRSGGWAKAVRSHRAKEAHQRRKSSDET